MTNRRFDERFPAWLRIVVLLTVLLGLHYGPAVVDAFEELRTLGKDLKKASELAREVATDLSLPGAGVTVTGYDEGRRALLFWWSPGPDAGSEEIFESNRLACERFRAAAPSLEAGAIIVFPVSEMSLSVGSIEAKRWSILDRCSAGTETRPEVLEKLLDRWEPL